MDEIVYLSNRHPATHHRGCRRPDGSCRARFPRDIVDHTTVSPDDGSISVKHTEPYFNKTNRLLSYLFRCNTDVTSVLSGTQLRALPAYITDYVTKSSLKTHAVFESVKAVLDRRTELIQTGPIPTNSGRSLIVKMVNSLSAKQEIGGPMVCQYLLGQPDHYTNMNFRVVFWVPYVGMVSAAWQEGATENDSPTSKDQVVVGRSDGKVVPVNRSHDWVYRPSAFDNYSLVQYLQETEVKSLTPRQKQQIVDGSLSMPSGPVDFTRTVDSDGDYSADEEESSERTSCPFYLFDSEHPRYRSHAVFVRKKGTCTVLNFVSGLPRRDKGDREFYCKTMLTFFAPGWRTGMELRYASETWDAAFRRQVDSFSASARLMMDRFDILYQCYDAKDDYAALRRAETSSDMPDLDETIESLGVTVAEQYQHVHLEGITQEQILDMLHDPLCVDNRILKKW
ncbi:hypothetical protein PUNSTDRAFT_71472 [Punctularia strigosozonata HHB-11173 SS5]|uniref:uncharacterized protein n=1 Tax=Punctularia strigosozonata (strain HHB-11173) TaxID=741275 RepID=UPI0004416B92|nr:uncharacterized protein PUNSTDRAFT_71472 [Punctularia strigosozonata HHB-11173 SS5]EIN07527.1 hypothetical protein PUNSTDRAFT_71472 [Punctularia strigosozonata HHB-11173 SS5]